MTMFMEASIKALPPSTVQLIGSTQVLLDAYSVIKELVENALDARATSLSIEVSTNTLDFIQVRDNGQGIAPEDRAMICRRHTTSKLSDLSDLKQCGGASLGFRGEALHSLAEMSCTLSITTRVEGEVSAVKLDIRKNGEVARRSNASHPVGTTVRVTYLLHSLPVRKQMALKASPNCLIRIRRLLQSYALVRCTVRISMRVLKAKSEKFNFLYVPNPGAVSVEDAVTKVIGRNCASQCQWSTVDLDEFELRAFLPRVDADFAKISSVGQYLSIDLRPVSTSRGTLKQIVALFKAKLVACGGKFESVKDPFLYLNINCSRASYDPNVEPAKDDVLFDDSLKVLSTVEKLLTVAYPVQKKYQNNTVPATLLPGAQETIRPRIKPRDEHLGYESIEYPKSKVSTTRATDVSAEGGEASLLEQREKKVAAWKMNMSGEEDFESSKEQDVRASSRADELPSDDSCHIQLFNPRTIETMNTPVGASRLGHCPSYAPLWEQRPPDSTAVLKTPGHSEDGENFTARQLRSAGPADFTPTSRMTTVSSQLMHYGLPTPQPPSSPAIGTLLDAIPGAPQRRMRFGDRATQGNIQKQSFLHPPDSNVPKNRKTDQDSASFPSMRLKVHANRCQNTSNAITTVQGEELVVQREPEAESADHGASFRDAIDLLDFQGHVRMPISRTGETTGPHLGHKELALVGEQPRASRDTELVPFHDHEPILQKVKKRRRTENRRIGSSLLPLERVPSNDQMQNSILCISTSIRVVSSSIAKLDMLDSLANWFELAEEAYGGFFAPLSPNEMQQWSRRSVNAFGQKCAAEDEMDVEGIERVIIAALTQLNAT